MHEVPAKLPTLTDVARRAGVSVPTASRVLNGGVRGTKSGSADVRERVEAAARDLGYSVSAAAQTTKGGRARTVAVVVSDLDDFGSAMVISGVMHAAEERGLSVSVRATKDDAQRELALLDRLRGERHQAILIATSRTTDAAREKAFGDRLRILQDQGARVVIFGDSDLPFPAVTVDNRGAARRLGFALAKTGRRRFAVVSGPEIELTALERAAGFVEGLADAGLDPENVLVLHHAFTRDGGYAATIELEDSLRDLDAIAAMSDAMAVGIIARLRERGVAVPDEIDVSGFDHVSLLGDVLPEFSTVEVPLRAFGESALSLAFNRRRASAATRVALDAQPILHGTSLT